jgi:hypothetical protein
MSVVCFLRTRHSGFLWARPADPRPCLSSQFRKGRAMDADRNRVTTVWLSVLTGAVIALLTIAI